MIRDVGRRGKDKPVTMGDVILMERLRLEGLTWPDVAAIVDFRPETCNRHVSDMRRNGPRWRRLAERAS